MDAKKLVDRERYPLEDRASEAYCSLVDTCRTDFGEVGVVVLPGFVLPEVIEAMATEAAALLPQAFFCRSEHNVYLGSTNAELAATHPRNRQQRTNVGSIANDYLTASGAIQRLYDWPALTTFIADVVGVEKLFLSEDPFGAVSVNVFEPGDAHAWHFDESRFSVTLMVQPADDGGDFEYTPRLRVEGDGDIAAICEFLDDAAVPRQLEFSPGTLSIFAGRHTMHRVTEVQGDKPRLVLVLTYSETPGYQNSPAVRELFWGRSG